MINQIRKTPAPLIIEDDGTVYIGAADGPSAKARCRSKRYRKPAGSRSRRTLPGYRGEGDRLRCVYLPDPR